MMETIEVKGKMKVFCHIFHIQASKQKSNLKSEIANEQIMQFQYKSQSYQTLFFFVYRFLLLS